MSQVVDVVELLKVQTINDFEKLISQFRKGYNNLKLTLILDKINFIELCGHFNDSCKLGNLLVDLSNQKSIDQLNSYLDQIAQKELEETNRVIKPINFTSSDDEEEAEEAEEAEESEEL